MKIVPSDAKCAYCGGRMLISQCLDCERWMCHSCNPSDVCRECRERKQAEDAAGIKRIERPYYR